MVKTTQNSWLGGQFDRELAGRQDIDRYRTGASELVNFLPVRRGSIRKRPGTDYVADITSYLGGAGAKFRMIPFGYTAEGGFVLIFKAGAARVYASDGTSAAVAGTVPYAADELDDICYTQCGDVIFLAHSKHPPAEIRHTYESGRHVFTYRACPFNSHNAVPHIVYSDMQRLTINDFYENGKTSAEGSADWYSQGYRGKARVVYRASLVIDAQEGLLSPELDSEVTEDGAASENEAPNVLTYTAPWTESQVISVCVAVRAEDFDTVRLYRDSGGLPGLVATAPKSRWIDLSDTTGWDENDWTVATRRLNNLETSVPVTTKSAKNGVVVTKAHLKRIQEAGYKYVYLFRDDYISPDTSQTPIEEKEVFAAAGDWPSAVAVYQQRLVWASSENDPARVWMSKTGDFYEHRPHEILQLDDPIDFILPLTRFARINFIFELGRLIMFSEACEWILGSNSDSSGINYETIQATPHSYIGSKRRLPPLFVNNAILFAERTGLAVRNYSYQVEANVFGGADVSVFSSSIFEDNPIVDWTYQQFPNSTVWCCLADGTMASLVFMQDQDVCAWARHELGGGGHALAVACTHALGGVDGAEPDTSETFIAVRRGSAVTLEKMRPWARQDMTSAEADYVTMDACRAAGGSVPDGMARAAGIDGYPFASAMTTLPPVLGNEVGNAQMDVKNARHVHLRYIASRGGKAGAKGGTLAPLKTIQSELATGDENIVLHGANNRDGRVRLVHSEPWPFQLLMMEVDYDVEEGGERNG